MVEASPHYMNQQEAAEYLGITPRRLRQLIKAGEGPRFISLGKTHHRYDLDDLVAWIESRKKNPRKTP